MPIRQRSFIGQTCASTGGLGEPHSKVLGGGEEKIAWGHNTTQAERNGPADSGSAMLLTRNITTYQFANGRHWNTKQYPKLGGQWYLLDVLQPPSGQAITDPTDSQVRANGTTAIARTTPTDPIFSATTFMGETLSDGLPHIAGASLWREKTRIAKGSGNEFLNYEFGWLPFVSDLRNFARVVKNHAKIIKDFQAGSGKNIRVGYDFPSNRNTGISRGGGFLILGGQTNVYDPAQVTVSWDSGNKQWFKGAFSYHLPVTNDQAARAIRFEAYANKLLGTRLTPEVVWNLTPWSWAADWFGNAGDIIHNVSALGHDGLVLRYGYMMSSTWNNSYHVGVGDNSKYTSTMKNVTETKHRHPATPYFGFGASASLSATQTAILAALGMTRGRRG